MRVELAIDRTKELPKGAIPAMDKELLKKLGNQYEGCSLSISRAGAGSFSVLGGDKDDIKKIESILQDYSRHSLSAYCNVKH